MHDQIAHGRVRKIELQRLPVRARIERDVDAVLGGGVEQARFDGILAHGVHRVVRQAVDGKLPRLAAVVRDVDVRPQIVEPKSVNRDEGGLVVEARRVDLRDLAPRRQRRRRDILPMCLPTVARDPDQPVVGSRPDRSFAHVRRRERVDDAAMPALLRIVAFKRAEDRRHAGMRARQVGADRAPALAAVIGREDDVRSEVETALVERIERQRLGADGAIPLRGQRDRRDLLRLARCARRTSRPFRQRRRRGEADRERRSRTPARRPDANRVRSSRPNRRD